MREVIDDVIEPVHYDVVDQIIPTDTNTAYCNYGTEGALCDDDVIAVSDQLSAGETKIAMEDNTAYSSCAVGEEQEMTDYDYVLR